MFQRPVHICVRIAAEEPLRRAEERHIFRTGCCCCCWGVVHATSAANLSVTRGSINFDKYAWQLDRFKGLVIPEAEADTILRGPCSLESDSDNVSRNDESTAIALANLTATAMASLAPGNTENVAIMAAASPGFGTREDGSIKRSIDDEVQVAAAAKCAT